MDPSPPPTTTTEPPHLRPKIRLMCSYGGHIIPRPQSKSLTYAGGETRIVAVDRRSTASTFSAFSHHLSRTLYNNSPFTLKYQLPNEDLDSLISITTDDDLHNMLEEHDRISSSANPARIRLFLFPARPESVGSLLLDPKSESWFSDALESSMIGKRGLSDGAECLGKCGGGGGEGSVQESVVLESCSSFGSVNSSVSGSIMAPVGGGNNEDSGGNLVEKKVIVAAAASGSIESDDSARIYQEQALLESESIIYNPASTVQMQRNVQVSGYHIPHTPDQRQQPVQYIQTATPHYIQYPTGPQLPISSYYPMYVPYQQQPNQPYPIYIMPVGPADQSYNVSAPTHMANSHVAYKEVTVSQPPAERAVVGQQPTPSNRVTAHLAQPVGPTTATPTDGYQNEYDNDLAYAQIYKSQPSVPAFLPQMFETVKKAEPLSDSLAQLQIGASKQ